MTFAQASFTKRSGLWFAATLLAASSATAAGIHGGGHDESPIGEAGVAGKVSRTIQVDAADSMRFTPSLVAVKKGETIRFVVTNSGKVPHEFSLGTEKELKEHYEVSVDYEGELYCGTTLKWNYEKRYVDISMPGYVDKALQ